MMSYSPLSIDEIKRIESINLSNIGRHHLRLLAHCLACFKEMANGVPIGSLPREQDRLNWLLAQPSLKNDRSFVFILLEQFVVAGLQLEKLAEEYGISPLELTLDQLIDSTLRAPEI